MSDNSDVQDHGRRRYNIVNIHNIVAVQGGYAPPRPIGSGTGHTYPRTGHTALGSASPTVLSRPAFLFSGLSFLF
jgi:hypothetical protein